MSASLVGSEMCIRDRPMAVAYSGAPVAASLPSTSFPGLTDTSCPVMAACHAVWNELVAMVGPDFVNQVSGEGAE
eukprot:7602084-Alexandrium_andersonii.AAC.1